MRKRGFTLIEVCVVLAILSILFAILMPVFQSAKEASQRTVSVSNLRQIYTGLSLYRADECGEGYYGDAYRMGLPPDLKNLADVQHLPKELFRSGCPSILAPVLPEALFRMMWHPDGDRTQENWAPYAERYRGSAVLLGDTNCDYRDRFYENPFVAHRGIGLYEDGHVGTIVAMGHTGPYQWWTVNKSE